MAAAGAATWVAIVTARGGSKGLPGKNLRPLAGLPLLVHSLRVAQAVPALAQVVLSTDDPAIADCGRAHGARVVDRPAELATDDASSVDVVLHALDALDAAGQPASHFVLLQPTSPLRRASHVQAAIDAVMQGGVACAVGACEAEHHPLKMLLDGGPDQPGGPRPVSGRWDDLHAPRQRLPRALRINGAVYAMASDVFRRERRFVLPPLHVVPMSAEDSIDIDTQADLDAAERVLAQRAQKREPEPPRAAGA